MNGMNLNEYLKSLHIDEIEDDDEFEERELEAIRRYLHKHTFNLTQEDEDTLRSRIDMEYYYDWMCDYDAEISNEEPWCVERWYDDDLISTMRVEGIPVTKENLDKFREHCRHIFDDKSERNEMLAQAAWECSDI